MTGEGDFTGETCSPQLRLQILHASQFFSHLSHTEVAELNESFVERGFTPGEAVVREGDPATHLYVVATGELRLRRSTPQGQDVVLDVLVPGDLFGSLPLLGDDHYSDTVEARTACCVLAVSADDFRGLLERYPKVSPVVLEFVAKRLRDAHDQIRHLSASAVRQRLAAMLVKLNAKLAAAKEDEPERLSLSQSDLAEMTGSTIETVNRTLRRFRQEGLVATGRGWVELLERDRLEEISGQAQS